MNQNQDRLSFFPLFLRQMAFTPKSDFHLLAGLIVAIILGVVNEYVENQNGLP